MEKTQSHGVSAPGLAAVAQQDERLLTWQRLLEWLQADQVIDGAQAQAAVAACLQNHSTQHPLLRLGQLGLVPKNHGQILDAAALTQWLAQRLDMPYWRIDALKVEASKVAETMSLAYAKSHKILPLQVGSKEVVVASAEPFVNDWVLELERQLRLKVCVVLAHPAEIERCTIEFFALARSVKAAQGLSGTAAQSSFEQLVDWGANPSSVEAHDGGVVQVVDWLWGRAFEQRASDIHIEPKREHGTIRFRIDGVLHTVDQMPHAVMSAVTARIKLLGRMDVVEKRRPQDGRIKIRRPQGDEVELRLSTLPTAFGEKLVMRIFDADTAQKSLTALGFPTSEARWWQELMRQTHGIVLVTGPTGSGKTSTLYATLKHLATEAVNISTIEDPIEMIEPSFNQTQTQAQLDLGFAEGLRALMRQDPDVIMVGEVRDLETAQIAMQAALTGHLVFSTLHTNDASAAISRLLDLGIAPYLINAAVIGVLAQRLLRTLCSHCKQPDASLSPSVLQELVPAWPLGEVFGPYRAVGCAECRMTGYKGRIGLYELLRPSAAFKARVHEGGGLHELQQQALQDGMRPLRWAGALKVAEGWTTVAEVLSATPVPCVPAESVLSN